MVDLPAQNITLPGFAASPACILHGITASPVTYPLTPHTVTFQTILPRKPRGQICTKAFFIFK